MLACLRCNNARCAPLGVDDLERVIAIDRAHTGHCPSAFLREAHGGRKAHPDDFIQVGVTRGGSLCGFAIARILRGEFGHEHAVAVLDAVGVEPESQERGVGQASCRSSSGACAEWAYARCSRRWTGRTTICCGSSMPRGFELAPRLALERSVAERLDEASEEE